MPVDVELALSEAISTAAPTTTGQCVVSVIHINRSPDNPAELVVLPATVEAYYTHHGGRGDEMRSHRLLWMAMFPREPGQLILIRLTGVKNPSFVKRTDDALQAALSVPNSKLPIFTWAIAHYENAVETHPITFPTDWYGRVNFKYDVELRSYGSDDVIVALLNRGLDLFDEGSREAYVDPSGNLIPDP